MAEIKRQRKTISVTDPDRLVTAHVWTWYGLSFFIPLCGIFIGLFLYDQDSREVRWVGRNSLFIGFVVWVIFPLAILLLVILAGMVALAGIFSQTFSG